MRVFISGPMSGLPDNNFPAFDAAAERLRAEGYEVVNPAELSRGIDRARRIADHKPACWHDYMAGCMLAMRDCDAIHYLPARQDSFGSMIESMVAGKMHLKEIL